MNFGDLRTIEQLTEFLSGVQPVAFSVIGGKDERYRWIQKLLTRLRYRGLSKADKGVVIRCIIKMTGYSRQQVTRLVKQHALTGRLKRRQRTVGGFERTYTREDILLLASMDKRHDTPCGPTMKKLCERAWCVFGEPEFERLAKISVSHLYNLRKSSTYKKRHRHFEKTKSKRSSIGERRKPRPGGKPGYLRVDTVHQGDSGKTKGVYHINAVDEITQFEIVVSVEKISERYLVPAIEEILEAFPFKILGFHSDNGSEYINHIVAKLLGKLLVEFTKSRARHCNDNALAESKNGAIVRKILGHSHIPQKWANELNVFHREHLNPYVNYHRPCFFPEVKTDAKGKQRKIYPYEKMMTPYEKFRSLPNAEQYLKDGESFKSLHKMAHASTDNQAARKLQRARDKLFKTIHERGNATG